MGTTTPIFLSELFKELYYEFLNPVQYKTVKFKKFTRHRVYFLGKFVGTIYE